MVYENYELRPLYINQKSFYGKAIVLVGGDGDDVCYALRSYDTFVVAVRFCSGGVASVEKRWGSYSRTTMRHVNEFLMQLGFPKLSAHAWRSMEVGEFYSSNEILALEYGITAI